MPSDTHIQDPSGPPSATRRPHVLSAHGDERCDDWYWLNDPDDPEVISYLEEENRYCDSVMQPTAALQEELFEQIRARVQETDSGPPARHGGWWYYSRTAEGLQYPVHCRRPDTGQDPAEVSAENRAGQPADEAVLLDENSLADGPYLAVGVLDVSPDHHLLAYAVDLDGSERYVLRFRDLSRGEDLADTVEDVYYGSAWSADSSTFFYVRPDTAMRPWQVWTHRLGRPNSEDRLLFQEDDERFFVSVGLSRSGERILVESESKTTSEVRFLDARTPEAELRTLLERRPGVEYSVDHDGGERWLVLMNRNPDGSPASNFALYAMAEEGTPELLMAHRPEVKIEAVDAFERFTAVVERSAEDGLERVRIRHRDGRDLVIEQPEAAYSLLGGNNPEWDQTTYRFGYTSLTTPRQSVDFDIASGERRPVWGQIVHGYDPSDYRTERVWATADDGTRVPVTLVCRADHRRDGSAAGLLYGYGSYEHSIEPAFSPIQLNLVERGVVYAIAHIRGGGELGRAWYEQGRMEHKSNTFTDFIAAADHLVAEGWVSPDRLAARGGSAGGLLMGAVVNLRPERWRAVVAEVPFVDVVTTMSDTSLPLTVTEWEEWGDPLHDQDAYRRMLAYSPYDNVRPREDWPAMFVTAGLNDPRVGYWEPAKWVARLRTCGAGTQQRPLVLRTEMGAGHQGSSGRYDAWRDECRVHAFLLTQLGAAPAL